MIHLSKSAVDEILRLKSKHAHANDRLRVGIQPSCCSSMAYVLEFDQKSRSDSQIPDGQGSDGQIYEIDKLEVIIDSHSAQYLNGLTVDYTEDLMGGGFRFHNPNATHTCGCGNAFSVG
jgi:iron-sulfur cluster assembly protein